MMKLLSSLEYDEGILEREEEFKVFDQIPLIETHNNLILQKIYEDSANIGLYDMQDIIRNCNQEGNRQRFPIPNDLKGKDCVFFDPFGD